MIPSSTRAALRIEPMQIEQVDTVADLDAEVSASRWTPQMFLSELLAHPPPSAPSSFVTWHHDEVVGYLIFRVILDELHFMNLAVRPSWQRRGLGAALVYFALQAGRQRGVSKSTLEVRASNVRAQKLYQKFGFKMVGRRPNYYAAPKEDALLFSYDGNRGAG